MEKWFIKHKLGDRYVKFGVGIIAAWQTVKIGDASSWDDLDTARKMLGSIHPDERGYFEIVKKKV